MNSSLTPSLMMMEHGYVLLRSLRALSSTGPNVSRIQKRNHREDSNTPPQNARRGTARFWPGSTLHVLAGSESRKTTPASVRYELKEACAEWRRRHPKEEKSE